jgi:chemotaxis protein methyltransferase CheR
VLHGLSIDDEELAAISQLVQARVGIELGESKRALIVARLASRLRALGYRNFRQYYEHLCRSDPAGEELRRMINRITTNKTEFFRESHHFEFLRDRLIPEAIANGRHRLRIWSAGCSTGQEPYSIAMTLAEDPRLSGFDMRILASDVDTDVLRRAEAGVYSKTDAASIPEAMRSRCLEVDGSTLRVPERVRKLVTFRQINLIDEQWPIRSLFDAIFCRNVTIYFDSETKAQLYRRLCAQLEPHGYLLAGHSENLSWLKETFTLVGGTVYCLTRACTDSGRPARGSWRAPRRSERAPSERVGASSRYVQSHPASSAACSEVKVPTGAVHASAKPSVASTVLGSCVAVCLFDPETGAGGMNHFMLPHALDSHLPQTRYGVHAIQALIAQIIALGGARSRLLAKVFGGARVLPLPEQQSAAEQNIQFVRTALAEHGIPTIAERLGGDEAIYVRFETHTGRAFVRVVSANETARQSAEPRQLPARRSAHQRRQDGRQRGPR